MIGWADEYFERGYAQRWGLPPISDHVRSEVSGLWDRLGLTHNALVLDVGCGHGRHALALAQRGPAVVGVDSAITLLQHARANTAAEPAHWVRGDMRRLPLLANQFDAAISLDAFGFFDSERENEAVLSEVSRVLTPGGRLALKIVNGTPIIANFRESDREERGGTVVMLSRALHADPPRMTEKVTVSGSRGAGEYERRQRLYHVDEMRALLEHAGLSISGVFASADGQPFDAAASATMWIVATRQPGPNER